MALKDFDHVSATSVASASRPSQSHTRCRSQSPLVRHRPFGYTERPRAPALRAGRCRSQDGAGPEHSRSRQEGFSDWRASLHCGRGQIILSSKSTMPCSPRPPAPWPRRSFAIKGTVGGNICQEPAAGTTARRQPISLSQEGRRHVRPPSWREPVSLNFRRSIVGSFPCSSGCPAEVEIPPISRTRARRTHDGGRPGFARKNPMPAITGRACPHFCELTCTRTGFDEAVSIRAVERHVAIIFS